MKIMVAGNHTVKQLSPVVTQMLNRMIEANHEIVIGDCSGVDILVQQYLKKQNYKNVHVITIKSHPRHNAGFGSFKIAGKCQVDKDAAMCRWAESALLVFHQTKSSTSGTGRNLERLQEMGKPAVVVVGKKYEVVKGN